MRLVNESGHKVGRRVVLLVEDEESIAEPLADALRVEGFDALVAGGAVEGLQRARDDHPDIVLLDLMLPDGDGRDVLRELRQTSSVPVLVLTARGQSVDRVVGLELGADDYVVKPFELAEVVARMRAVLRRSGPNPTSDQATVLRLGDLELNLATRSVTVAGQPVNLTLKEFEVLRILMQRPGEVIRRGELMDEVWDPHWYGSDRTLDVHVSSLRQKLGDDPSSPRYIATVRGVGFHSVIPERVVG
jgi:DNA-binding response OmpR family regulator